MSDHGKPGPEALQFDEAEYAGGEGAAEAATCGACRREIIENYYATNGVIVCEPCRMLIERAQVGGSGVGRFLRASVFGSLAAAAGFAIYFGILKTTGYQVGLISILVGLMVGKAVRAGSRGRGGWLYPLLAMFLVYTSIAASYGAVILPKLIADLVEQQEAKDAAAKADAAKPGRAANAKDAPAADVVANANPAAADDIKPPSTVGGLLLLLGTLVLVLIAAVAFFFAIPILSGFEAPMGLVIVGFALWEAWKINRRTKIVFDGPYWVEDTPPSGALAQS